MTFQNLTATRLVTVLLISLIFSGSGITQTTEVDRLVGAMLGETPMLEDLQQLCDEIGGRPTGSEANLKSVDWALQKFEEAGVTARKESFTMPRFWLERSCEATVTGDVSFKPDVVTMTFSAATPEDGLTAPLVDGGMGTVQDFARLGSKARGAFVLIETQELVDVSGLFEEYANAAETEPRAFAAGAAGVVYMSSRAQGLLYRHNASKGPENEHPMLVMEREEAKRASRLLRAGKSLNLTAKIDIQSGGEYESYNVLGEIPGSEKPDEFVVVGAHLDSWGLGTGANDNGCNVVMMIDIARQMKRLGVRPKRTVRFALWNGEEQGLIGSWRYTQAHADELDGHIMACSVDIGSGRILGFFTNGREELIAPVNRALEPVKGLGPFEPINMPIVGTDNYDFMMQGIANLVANHDPYNYAPNYHAESDTYDKVDLRQLRLNAAIMAALTYGFANLEVTWKRQTRAEIQQLIDSTPLRQRMNMFNLYPAWADGSRGRSE
ncbi:M20/M25/M40 family metallo-hydrolase [candidate division KSB1 bacterium]|nr:M20/M25/M40 family metallo-hydrolase [candidate division KSB1 bacterium]NIR68994.1 M20/M25/M40 family metallo-hydrolase [candidate division KSB1 bacterium]NIS22616.1 M20/M25/M40 family metallo-hydrolase [candidate division KSB1 bacterium]NIT69476.1 M20/M25/M40 family metallo-hydrolase [candidate division KSB1 bacterium]NIU23131.1 M20/M25/M40 family metallo-hydrolase [candidate division KSB1 bacterium]